MKSTQEYKKEFYKKFHYDFYGETHEEHMNNFKKLVWSWIESALKSEYKRGYEQRKVNEYQQGAKEEREKIKKIVKSLISENKEFGLTEKNYALNEFLDSLSQKK